MRRTVLALAALALLPSAHAHAQLSSVVVPFAPYGDALCCNAATPLELTTSSVLVTIEGPDSMAPSADDVTLLIEGIGGTPTVTPLATPFASHYSPKMERLSATRALLAHAGADGNFQTGDDGVYLLDDLGGANTVTDLTTGPLWTGDAFTPTRLGPDSAVVTTLGADGAPSTADDSVAILTNLGGANDIDFLLLGSVFIGSTHRPAAVSETSFLFGSYGPDFMQGTADDEVVLVQDAGGANTQTPLATPYLHEYKGSEPVVLDPTRALVSALGPDAALGTADDVTFLLTGLDGTPAVTPLATPGQLDWGGGGVARLDATTALLAGEGPDLLPGTADDVVHLLSDLGGTPTVTPVTVGFLLQGRASLPVPLGAAAAALATAGPNGVTNDADDEVAILSGLGGANAVDRIPVPGLSDHQASQPVALLPGLAVTGGGSDGSLDSTGGDDVLTFVGDALGTPTTQETALGEVDENTGDFRARPLGNGRAVMLDAGADLSLRNGMDDGLRVVSGLAGGMTFEAQQITVKYDTLKPEKGEKVAAKALLLLPEPDRFTEGELSVRVGNAHQVIPGSAFVLKKGKWTYTDKKGLAGFVRKVSWHPEKGKLQVKGKGVATGAETTNADNVVLSLESPTFYAAVAHDGVVKQKKIVYKAPK